jgi:hypothetical protein
MEERLQRIKASFELFDKLKCCLDDLNKDCSDDQALCLVEEDKMRCHILNCLAALSVIQILRKRQQKALDIDNEKDDLLKRKVFWAACSMMMDPDFENDEVVTSTILSAYPDEGKMSDGRNWLPIHFAIVLFNQNKITEEDVYMLYTTDPSAMYRSSVIELLDEDEVWEDRIGCTPAHLLCMQKEPNMSMVKYFCLRDPKAFLLCDQSMRCTLHLAAEYSESVELLQTMLQIDHSMTKSGFYDTRPLGFLCRRLGFPTFHRMIVCLLEVDSSVEVIYNGIIECITSYDEREYKDHFINPGSPAERIVILLRILVNSNLDVMKMNNWSIFHLACSDLRGELGVAVLSLFIAKDSTGVKAFRNGYLPIHTAAIYSSLDVLKLLQKAYPESLSMLTNDGNNFLDLAFSTYLSGCTYFSGIKDMRDKVQYLCDQCPVFIHQKNNNGLTPLHSYLLKARFDVNSVIHLCAADETVVRDKCTFSNIDNEHFEQLPLHFLIAYKAFNSEISGEADCFRLFLSLYPASAGIKDGHLISPYDLAVSGDLSTYFLRMLLAADPTIDPERRHNLNFAARRDGMFLAFRALSSNAKATIWSKIRYEDKNLLKNVIAYL